MGGDMSIELDLLGKKLDALTAAINALAGALVEQNFKPATQPIREVMTPPATPGATMMPVATPPAKPKGIPSRDDPIGLREYFRAVGKEFNGFINRVEASENLGEKTIEVTSPYFKDKDDFGRFAGHMKGTFDAEYIADRNAKRYYWVIKKP